MSHDLIVIGTRSMQKYAKAVAEELEGSLVKQSTIYGETFVKRFADGEMEVEIPQTIRSKNVFLIAHCGNNELQLSNEEQKIELYHTLDALMRSQARSVSVFEPYISTSRSDRTTRRNSVGFWVHYKTMQSLGMRHYITYQLHSDKSKTVVDPNLCLIDDVPAFSLLKEHMCMEFNIDQDFMENEIKKNWLFCSVDAGGEGIAKKFAESFNAAVCISIKQRNYEKANTVDSIRILADTVLDGKTIWVVDDMIDTAGSVFELVKELKKRNVNKVSIIIVHAVLSGPALKRLNTLHEEGFLDTVYALDTLPTIRKTAEDYSFIRVVSTIQRSAKIIERLHTGGSLGRFFDSFCVDEWIKSNALDFS